MFVQHVILVGGVSVSHDTGFRKLSDRNPPTMKATRGVWGLDGFGALRSSGASSPEVPELRTRIAEGEEGYKKKQTSPALVQFLTRYSHIKQNRALGCIRQKVIPRIREPSPN